jgi:hypothetical protein
MFNFIKIIEDQSSKKIPLLYTILFGLKKETYQQVDTTNMMKNKENIINSNMMYSQNHNNNKMYIEQNDQPKPWIID